MALGGKRPGAGRKKGGISQKTRLRHELTKKAVAAGLTPMEFMLQQMRDPTNDMALRMDAAKAVAPYIHPKLATVEHKGSLDGEITHKFDIAEAARRIAFTLAGAAVKTDA